MTWDNSIMPHRNLPESPENVPQAKSETDGLDITIRSTQLRLIDTIH